MTTQHILGIDIGGTKCAIVTGRILPEGQIEIIGKNAFPTETAKGFDHTIGNIYANIDSVLTKTGLSPKDIAAVGISCGGPLDSKKGLILSPPNLPGWDHIPIVELIEKRYGVQTAVQNDANACTLAEWKFGAGCGYNNVIFLTFGTGMGAGLILDGKLYAGTNDMAGEVGHIRLECTGPVGYGKAGSFEGFCSGGGISQFGFDMAKEAYEKGIRPSFYTPDMTEKDVTAKTVGDAAEKGDKTAIDIYRVCGEYLGRTLAILLDILNPERVVIGSIFARSENLLRESMRRALIEEALPQCVDICEIVPAKLGDAIGDYAALATALR